MADKQVMHRLDQLGRELDEIKQMRFLAAGRAPSRTVRDLRTRHSFLANADSSPDNLPGPKGKFSIDFEKIWKLIPSYWAFEINKNFDLDYRSIVENDGWTPFYRSQNAGRYDFVDRNWSRVRIQPKRYPARIAIYGSTSEGGWQPVVDYHIVERGTHQNEMLEFTFSAGFTDVTFTFNPDQEETGITGVAPPFGISSTAVNLPVRPSNLRVDTLQANTAIVQVSVNGSRLRRIQIGDWWHWPKNTIERCRLVGAINDVAILDVH